MLHICDNREERYMFCVCPHCFKVNGMSKYAFGMETRYYRSCPTCSKPFPNPKKLTDIAEVRLRWHLDKTLAGETS
jgi:hypothetical protein